MDEDDKNMYTFKHNDKFVKVYRKRFKDGVDSKSYIQFKTQKGNKKLIGMSEFKIEINSGDTFVSYRDFKNYINRSKNKNSELYKQLRSYVNISKLEPIFSVTQHRDRFYLQDNDGKTIFTISFDEVIYSKELLKKTYFVIEFEINEIIMANSKKINSDALVKGLDEFVHNLDEGNILFNRTYDSKYAVGINKLGIKPKTEDIIEIILIFFALFSILILFCIPFFSRIMSVSKANNNKINVGSLK